eukprot:CCRYP_003224-RA/>CCRYP_003224-RA protein AED:0.55 eAED:0.36 QI:0/0/0/1/1/1/2/0/345
MELKGETGEALQETKDQAMETSCYEYLACFVIWAANREKYEGLKDKLNNDFLKGKDMYPKRMEEALRLLQNHEGGKRQEHRPGYTNTGEQAGVAFAQQGTWANNAPRDILKDKCFNCGQLGHHAVNCGMLSDEQRTALGVSNLVLDNKDGVSMSSDDEGLLEGVGFLEVKHRTTCDRNKIYLDSCATNRTIFMEELKEHFDWDGEETEFDEALVEQLVHPELPSKFQGVLYDQDIEDNQDVVVTPDPEPNNAAIAAAAANANLAPVSLSEITGVKLRNAMEPLHVTDKELNNIEDNHILYHHANENYAHFNNDNDVPHFDGDAPSTLLSRMMAHPTKERGSQQCK